MEMKDKNNEKVRVNVCTKDLIALCYIIDDFDNFNHNLAKFIAKQKEGKIGSIIDKLEKMSRGVFTLASKDISNFYQENEEVIKIINCHTNMNMFIWRNYNNQGKVQTNLANAAKYIKRNKDAIKHMINLLERLNFLNFFEIELDENIDFTKEEYEIAKTFTANSNLFYVDNIKIIPSYDTDIIKYETINSNYRMNLKVSQNGFSRYIRQITVNSLTFDSNELPKIISEDSIFKGLLELASCRETEQRVLKFLVDLGVNIDDLINQFDKSLININNLNITASKDVFKEILILQQIKTELLSLKQINDDYEEKMLQKYPRISSKNLENAKSLYLKKRTNSHLD